MGFDISAEALEVARENARHLDLVAQSRFVLGDMAQLAAEPFDLVVSNPPYISSAEFAELMPEVRDFEPSRALLAGRDGLDCYRLLTAQVQKILKPGGWLLLEIGCLQEQSVSELLKQAGLSDIYCRQDYAGHPRVVAGRRDL
jgi:release factor glutamine methyltransferase